MFEAMLTGLGQDVKKVAKDFANKPVPLGKAVLVGAGAVVLAYLIAKNNPVVVVVTLVAHS